ncbi:MAG: hypothetical protein HQL50_15275, partial [Magnetococcales bacterium]|nr:hypothetical protein [Magnetococcales bacterium]
MPEFRFKAMNAQGKIVRGGMEANTIDDLESRLGKLDLELINCKERTFKSKGASRAKVSRKDLLT